MQIGALTPKADAKVRTTGETAKLSREKFQENMKVFLFLDKMNHFTSVFIPFFGVKGDLGRGERGVKGSYELKICHFR